MAYRVPTNEAGVFLFAQRRPDWRLPDIDEVHADLQLSQELSTEQAGQRKPCPRCNRSRSMYCFDCLIPLVEVPALHLPFSFSIITHRAENASKNTGVQAHILAPQQVELHDIDHFPADFDPARSVVLFPCDDAVTVEQLEPGSVERAIIIDSKWRKARELIGHPALAGVRRVKLTHTRTAFWRFHTAGVTEEGVCTLEAMLHFVRAMAVHNKLAPEQLPSLLRSHKAKPSAPSAAVISSDAVIAQVHPREEQATQSNCQQGGQAAAQTNTAHLDPQAGRETNNGSTEAPAALQPNGTDGTQQGPGDNGSSSMTAVEQALFHAWDDLMFFFKAQHKHIEAIAQRRLEERKARKEQGVEPASCKKRRKERTSPPAQQLVQQQPGAMPELQAT